MSGVKVSIIVPVHNAKNYIAETVNSVLSQTEKDWELILAENGSDDGTAEDDLSALVTDRFEV